MGKSTQKWVVKADIWDGDHRILFLARWPERIVAAATS